MTGPERIANRLAARPGPPNADVGLKRAVIVGDPNFVAQRTMGR